MLVCENYEARISALIDDELTAQERVEVLEHIAQCPACRAYWEDQLLIRDALREPEAAPAGFADAVMARVRETAQDKCTEPEKKTLRFPGWKRFAGLAACCAVVLLGVWMMRALPGFGMEMAATNNCAAPQMYARDENLPGNAAKSYGANTADGAAEIPEADNGAYDIGGVATYNAPPESAVESEADDARLDAKESGAAAMLTTGSDVAQQWVEDNLGEVWFSGARYALSEEQYGELRKALEDAGETFSVLMGENNSGGYELLAE